VNESVCVIDMMRRVGAGFVVVVFAGHVLVYMMSYGVQSIEKCSRHPSASWDPF
jgi:hypothetical protein